MVEIHNYSSSSSNSNSSSASSSSSRGRVLVVVKPKGHLGKTPNNRHKIVPCEQNQASSINNIPECPLPRVVGEEEEMVEVYHRRKDSLFSIE